MSKKPFKATSFRKLMIFVFIIVILGIGGAFYYGLGLIREYAIEVTHTSEDAKASGDQINQLQTLQQELETTQALVNKANELFATEQTYQTQAITDLQKYANEAGVAITSTNFDQGDTPPQGARRVTITLTEPVNYQNLIRFLSLVEGSIPKMQVVTLTTSRPQGATTTEDVVVEPIVINISVR